MRPKAGSSACMRVRATRAPRREPQGLRRGPSPAHESPGAAIPGPGSLEAGQTVGQRRFLELDLWKAPRQEVVVGLHVEVPVSAKVEQDDLRLAGLPRTDRLVDHRPDGVVRLRGRHDPLSLERTVRPRRTPGSACTREPPYARASPAWTARARRRGTGARPRAPVPAQTCAPGCTWARGRHLPRVAEVVGELTPGQAGGRLGGYERGIELPSQLVGHERIGEARVVRTPAHAPDDEPGIRPPSPSASASPGRSRSGAGARAPARSSGSSWCRHWWPRPRPPR